MQSWNPYPFFRLIIPFGLGILLAIYTGLPHGIPTSFLIILSVVFFIPAVLVFFLNSYRFRWVTGFFIYLFAFIAGYSLAIFQNPANQPGNISNSFENKDYFVVRISEPITLKSRSVKTFGKFEWAFDSAGSLPVSGKVLLYFETDSAALNLQYGDYVIIKVKISEVAPPGNPHQFDYKKYLAHSGVYHQVFLKTDDWVKTGRRFVNPVFQFAFSARDEMLKILQANGLAGDEYAVVSAILLGYDESMDQELRDKYAGAGALHVLCVSGLHVGIIFFILSFLLKPLNRNSRTRFIKMILLLGSIWAYAFITGLSPSVMRAAVMFSLFSWRESRKEKSNPYNILAASAFILLIIDPYMITKIGFQLSYAAVLAIMALFKPIYSFVAIKNPVLDYVWQLLVVSFAAQVVTFPLAIYYFHQFPVYFFLTNLIVIPLVWLILNAGIIVLAASVISKFIAVKLSFILYLMLFALNSSVDFIHSIPGSVIYGLVLFMPQVILLYLIIIWIMRAFAAKNTRLILAAAIGLIFFTGSLIYRKVEILQQQKLVVYQINGHTAIDAISGTHSVFVADSSLYQDKKNIAFNIEGNRIFSGVKDVFRFGQQPGSFYVINSEKGNKEVDLPEFMLIGNKRIAFIDKDFSAFQPAEPLKVDYLILRNNPKVSIQELQKQFDFEKLIFDSSNSFWKINGWREYCDNTGVIYHDVKTNGYFQTALINP